MIKKYIPAGASLVVLVGPSGGGKSTFCEKHFESREVVGTDAIRHELTGDLRRQDKNDGFVFPEFHRRIEVKIQAGQRVVADATHLRDRDRRATAEVGLMLDVPVTYVVIDRPLEAKLQTGGWRLDVRMKGGLGLIESHNQTFKANESKILKGDHLKGVQVVDTRVDDFEVVQLLPRVPNVAPHLLDRGFEHLRVVGDVHGNRAGYIEAVATIPDKTFLLFLGDIVDYDPDGIFVTEQLLHMMRHGVAANLRGNHEKKIANWIISERRGGFEGRVSHGNEATVNVLKAMSGPNRVAWETKFLSMVDMSPDWIQFGDWLFTHGAAHHTMWNNTLFRAPKNSKLESFAMFGETTGEFIGGYPVRKYDWVDKISARRHVVVGHAILSYMEPVIKTGAYGGKAIFLDTGSSKQEDDTGVPGHLSWIDFDLLPTERGLEFGGFGRE